MFEDNIFPLMESKSNKEPFQVWNDETCNNIVHLFTVTGDAIKRIRGNIYKKLTRANPGCARLHVQVQVLI